MIHYLKQLVLSGGVLAAALPAFAITATKAYVDSATNATLTASKTYTDEKVAEVGGVTRQDVTNIAEAVVAPATNAALFAATNYAAASSAQAFSAATNFTVSATNAVAVALRASDAAVATSATNYTVSATNALSTKIYVTTGYDGYGFLPSATSSAAGLWFSGYGKLWSTYDGHASLLKWDNNQIAYTSITNGLVSATNPAFTNAVLQTFTDNIGTNAIAVLNEIGGLPITPGQTGGTIAALLAAIAAAIAWLKKKKIDKLTCSGVADITTENGAADVSTLFSRGNTSLRADNIRMTVDDATTIRAYIDAKLGDIETSLQRILGGN